MGFCLANFITGLFAHRERDSDKDRRMNFKEFFHGIFYLVRNYKEENQNSSHSDDSTEGPAKILFSQLDKDNGGY